MRQKRGRGRGCGGKYNSSTSVSQDVRPLFVSVLSSLLTFFIIFLAIRLIKLDSLSLEVRETDTRRNMDHIQVLSTKYGFSKDII